MFLINTNYVKTQSNCFRLRCCYSLNDDDNYSSCFRFDRSAMFQWR